MTDETRPDRLAPRRRRPQPPPFPPRPRRLDRAAGVRLAGRVPRLLAAEAPAAWPTTATGAPLRTAFVYFPNGAIPGLWWPERRGDRLPVQAARCSRWSRSRSQVQVLGGLNHRTADGGPDGAGDHARGNGTFLTGVRLKKSATDIRAGVSIDQVIARQIGHLTRFPSLELACDSGRKSGACDSGYSCAYQYNLSWSSPTTPMPPESNPRLAFERLFGAGTPGERQANLERRRQEQRSILDFVLDDARSMQRRLGSEDQAEARPVPGRRPRDRDADREGRAVRRRPRPERRDPGGRPGRTTRNTSSSCSTCWSWRSRPTRPAWRP